MSNKHHDAQLQAMAETLPQDKGASACALLPPITMAEATTLLDFSPEALVMIDAVGTIVLMNEQAAALFGYTKEELKHRSLEMVLPERFHVAYAAHWLRYVSTPHPRPMGGSRSGGATQGWQRVSSRYQCTPCFVGTGASCGGSDP